MYVAGFGIIGVILGPVIEPRAMNGRDTTYITVNRDRGRVTADIHEYRIRSWRHDQALYFYQRSLTWFSGVIPHSPDVEVFYAPAFVLCGLIWSGLLFALFPKPDKTQGS